MDKTKITMAQQTDHIVDVNKMITAVEWLLKRYTKNPYDCLISTGLFEIAKEMEKLQIMQSYNDGKIEYIDSDVERTSENYYNETYGK